MAGSLKEIFEVKDDNIKLRYSKKQVQRAGEQLILSNIDTEQPEIYKESMDILSNWRAGHINSLNIASKNLQSACDKFDRRSIIVTRLKRTPSIIGKLKRFDKMKLRNMQDIAGCRAIVTKSKHINKIKRELHKHNDFRTYDYIKNPKPDGYRGVHLIGKFYDEVNNIDYPVEIQLRSKIQHTWATAVEIVDLFTNQSIKTNNGNRKWMRFFQCVSSKFSDIENYTNETGLKTTKEIIQLSRKLDIYKKFDAFANSVKLIEKKLKVNAGDYNLIVVDFEINQVTVRQYPSSDFNKAATDYLYLEKKSTRTGKSVVALVSSISISNLREAYPNYFADSAKFISYLRDVETEYQKHELGKLSWLQAILKKSGL